MLLQGWEASIQEFRKAYVEMQQKITQCVIESDKNQAEIGIEAEFDQLN